MAINGWPELMNQRESERWYAWERDGNLPVIKPRRKKRFHEKYNNGVEILISLLVISSFLPPPFVAWLQMNAVSIVTRRVYKGAVGCCFLLSSMSRLRVDVFRISFFSFFDEEKQKRRWNRHSVVCRFLCTIGRHSRCDEIILKRLRISLVINSRELWVIQVTEIRELVNLRQIYVDFWTFVFV